jgi:hypothetical protein
MIDVAALQPAHPQLPDGPGATRLPAPEEPEKKSPRNAVEKENT